MNWGEYDEIFNEPQREAERKIEQEKRFEDLDDQQRMAE